MYLLLVMVLVFGDLRFLLFSKHKDICFCMNEDICFCFMTSIPQNIVNNNDFSIKIGEFVVDRKFAMDYISKRKDAHHFKLSKWKDLQISIHI